MHAFASLLVLLVLVRAAASDVQHIAWADPVYAPATHDSDSP